MTPIQELRMRLADRELTCCEQRQTGEPVTEERYYENGVVLVDAPLLRCPVCGRQYRDVFLGALLEEAVAGLPAGLLTMEGLLKLLEGPWEDGEVG